MSGHVYVLEIGFWNCVVVFVGFWGFLVILLPSLITQFLYRFWVLTVKPVTKLRYYENTVISTPCMVENLLKKERDLQFIYNMLTICSRSKIKRHTVTLSMCYILYYFIKTKISNSMPHHWCLIFCTIKNDINGQ